MNTNQKIQDIFYLFSSHFSGGVAVFGIGSTSNGTRTGGISVSTSNVTVVSSGVSVVTLVTQADWSHV